MTLFDQGPGRTSYGLVLLDMGARLMIEMLQKVQQKQNIAELKEMIEEVA
jgi:hypothetical protein